MMKRKAFTIILALVLSVSLCVPVFASTETAISAVDTGREEADETDETNSDEPQYQSVDVDEVDVNGSIEEIDGSAEEETIIENDVLPEETETINIIKYYTPDAIKPVQDQVTHIKERCWPRTMIRGLWLFVTFQHFIIRLSCLFLLTIFTLCCCLTNNTYKKSNYGYSLV